MTMTMTAVHIIAVEAALQSSLSRELALHDLQALHSAGSGIFNTDITVVALPLSQALEQVRALRAAPASREAGIVAMTATTGSTDVIALIEAGADDVVGDVEALPYRLKALHGRMNPVRNVARLVGGVAYDLDRHECYVHDMAVHLTPSEGAILAKLCTAPGKVFNRSTMVNAAGISSVKQDSDKVLDVHVSTLRKRITAAGGGREFLETIPGSGFRVAPAAANPH